jgi:hypothetical protein
MILTGRLYKMDNKVIELVEYLKENGYEVSKCMLENWSAKISGLILDTGNELPVEVLAELIGIAGIYNGIGDFRAQCTGTFGRFSLKENK